MEKYKTFIKYIIVALSSSVIDIILFNIFNKLIALSIFISTIIARIISSLYNYILNKNKVFDNKDKINNSIIYYYMLVVITMILSGLFVSIFDKIIPIPTTVIKIIVDGALFVMNYFIQKLFIFKKTGSLSNSVGRQ